MSGSSEPLIILIDYKLILLYNIPGEKNVKKN